MATEPSDRPSSSSSAASSDSPTVPPLNISKRGLYNLNSQAPGPTSPSRAPSASANSSNASLPNFSRPGGQLQPQTEVPSRKPSPLGLSSAHDAHRHRPRQHSQGFFEPSLPSASMAEQQASSGNMTPLSASRIAAQTAMQHQTSTGQQHLRNRSSTIPPQQDNAGAGRKVSSPPPPLPQPSATGGQKGSPTGGSGGSSYQNGIVGGRSAAAATAANLAFPRNPALTLPPPGSEQQGQQHESSASNKQKGEKSKMKLFSKPKNMVISRDKDSDRRDKPLPSPGKIALPGPSGLSRMVNVSTPSLNESTPSSNSSMYNLSNSSAATVVPADRQSHEKEKDKDKEKEKHKHHFLSRPKLKLKDKDKDDHHLPLSSASSNSKPLDPSAPQSLYSFAPSSPSTTSFGKSMSGLDLRHGGRALREKKKEEKEKGKAEKAAAAAAAVTAQDSTQRDADQVGGLGDAAASEILQSFGLQNMAPEDAWDFLKAKLLVLFEGEEIRIALEDLNKLVSIHLRRCIQNHMPSVIVEDLRDLLQTGFSSINHSLLSVPDDRLVPYLAQTWLFVFGTVLPFIQAVFLPLDLEFKGRGSIMKFNEAIEFWGAMPNGEAMGDELDVRDIVLSTFRDTIILNRYDLLKNTFSQLSLDKINIPADPATNGNTRRPSTSSGPLDANLASFNSQGSTVLNPPGSSGSDNINNNNNAPLRDRATSNTSSNPDLPFLQTAASTYSTSFSPPQTSVLSQVQTHPVFPRPDPSLLITETVGRMFQCISVLDGVKSDDEAQLQVEDLSKAIKLNWLGRARTGRDRRGFVGTKVRRSQPLRRFMDDAAGKKFVGVVGGQ